MIEEIITQLEENYGRRGTGHNFVLTAGVWSSADHAVIELRGKGETLKFLAKMARFPVVSGQVQHEAKILRKLHDMHVTHIPEVVLDGSCEGRAFFVERFIEGTRLKDTALSEAEKLQTLLGWMKRFYSQTRGNPIEPRELVQRAEKARELASEFIDLTEAVAVLEKTIPNDKIPGVCWHGDAFDVNFLSTKNGLVGVDFGYSEFDQTPAEPYVLVPPGTLSEHAEELDVLSSLSHVNPLFLAVYATVMHLDQRLRVQKELEDNLLLVDRLHDFPSRELGKIEILLQCYNESKGREK